MKTETAKLDEQGNSNKPLLSAGVSHYIGKFRIELRDDGGLKITTMPPDEAKEGNIMVRPVVSNQVVIYACR